MEFDELFKFVKEEHKRLMEFYGFEDKEHITYPMVLKVMEELGELSEAILHSKSLQRNEKLNSKKVKLEEEFVDVLLTTLLLAENFDIDIRNELRKKIEKIKNRNY
ncbi:MAG: MazG nucleotide pyrophosphohydrolase domain-containing protein [Candidatus Woesearchaeota archaeon]